MKLREILFEQSTDQQGLYKAVVLAGLPAAGKSTLVRHILTQHPNVVHAVMDNYIERKLGKGEWTDTNLSQSQQYQAKLATEEDILDAATEGKPLVVELVGLDKNTTTTRLVTLRKMGYDILMLWVDIDVDESIRRNIERNKRGGRQVKVEWIEQQRKDYQERAHVLASYQQLLGRGNVLVLNGMEYPAYANKGKDAISKFMSTKSAHKKPPKSAHDRYITQRWYTRWDQ